MNLLTHNASSGYFCDHRQLSARNEDGQVENSLDLLLEDGKVCREISSWMHVYIVPR